MNARRERRSIERDRKYQRHLMWRAMHIESASDVVGLTALKHRRPRHFRWNESSFGIFRALQNFFVHFAVPGLVAAVAAGGVNDNHPACRPGRRIKLNCPALQLE